MLAIAGFGDLRDQLSMIQAVFAKATPIYYRTADADEEFSKRPGTGLLYHILPMLKSGSVLSDFALDDAAYHVLAELTNADSYECLHEKASLALPSDGTAFITWGGEHLLSGQLLLTKCDSEWDRWRAKLTDLERRTLVLEPVAPTQGRSAACLVGDAPMSHWVEENWQTLADDRGLHCFGFDSIITKLAGDWYPSDEEDTNVLACGGELVKSSEPLGAGAYSYHRVHDPLAYDVIVRGCPKSVAVHAEAQVANAEALARSWFSETPTKAIQICATLLPRIAPWCALTRADDGKRLILSAARPTAQNEIQEMFRLWW